MIYQNEHLRIVPFERAKHMTEEYRSWFNDPEVTKYNSHGLFPYTPGAMEAFVKTIEQGSDSKIVWAIETISNKGRILNYTPHGTEDFLATHIGNCSLDRINWINRSAELTIVLGRERGKGHGEQACRWMLEHAFDKLNLNRVWTGTAFTNEGMNVICGRIGMQHEGTLNEGIFLNGRFEDIMMYGITRKQYDAHIRRSK